MFIEDAPVLKGLQKIIQEEKAFDEFLNDGICLLLSSWILYHPSMSLIDD